MSADPSPHATPSRPAPQPSDRRPAGGRVAAALAAAAPALGAYAAVRIVGLVVFWVAASAAGRDALHLLSERWDSVWYQRVAEHGYGYTVITLADGGIHSDLAFFPLLPALERGVAEVTPLGLAGAGLLVAWVAGLLAAWGIFAVGARLYGRRAGVVLAALWGVYPTAFVQSMAYTETLFTALAAWSLYAVLTRRWIVAGALCVLAGLTRPSAAALIAALAITAAATLVREYRAGDTDGIVRRNGRMLLGVVLAPLGWLAYVVFVAVREGSPFAYFDVQAQWGNSIDGGAALASFILGLPLPGALGLCAALAGLGWLVYLCVRQRQPLPVLVYGIAVVVISLIGSGYFGSRPRLMMPAFPLLLPPAVALLRLRSTARTAGILAVLAAASAAYGAWTLLGSGPP
ncbi:glycosyltransferase family 39 protein [Streptomyces sp. NPDC091267]|uniref:glycosyltransferase family 39 protein n=1 Tax=Streptomyces sp. NPDC091267 TaxID=3155195 RepID=UPI00341ED31C